MNRSIISTKNRRDTFEKIMGITNIRTSAPRLFIFVGKQRPWEFGSWEWTWSLE